MFIRVSTVRKMHFANKIVAQTVLISGIIFMHVCSGEPNNTSHPKKYHPESKPLPPQIFPNSSQNETDTPVIPFNQSMLIPNVTTVCWPDVSKAYWGTVLHNDAKYTGKHYQRLMARYRELNGVFADHLKQVILAADEIRALLYYNSTHEEIMEARNKTNAQEPAANGQKKENTTAEILKKCNCSRNAATDSSNNVNTEILQDDSTKSITVPILLIVILVLLTYIAFLYRKLQFARYKDAQILVQDELIDPWATR